MSAAVFTRKGDVLVPSAHARGPWDPNALHGGAPAAAIARAVEQVAPGMRLARLTVELLGAVPLLPLSVEAEVVKPGRSFQVVDVRASAGGREVAWARANLIRRQETEDLATDEAQPVPPPPDDLEPAVFRYMDGEGFATSTMDVRFTAGSFDELGPATAWFRLGRPVVEGEEPSPAQRAAAVSDFGNGISRVLDWRERLFVNTDLTLHLHRDPEGEWIALQAETILQPNGSGLATSTLFDHRGRVGAAAQSLFVGPRGE